MTIRRIRLDDGLLVKAVRLAALKDAPYAFSGTYAAASQREESTWHADAERNSRGDDSATFFAFVGDEAVGMAGCYRDGARRELGHLVAVWVRPEQRGTGVSAALIDAVEQWARSVGLAEITAWVTDNNPRAIGCYEKLGYVRQPESRPNPHTPGVLEILTLKSLR